MTRLFRAGDWPDYAATATIYRNAAGTAQAIAGTVVGALVPAATFRASPLDAAPDGLGGGRYDMALIHGAGALARVGDELRIAGQRYTVQRADLWGGDGVAFVEQIGF